MRAAPKVFVSYAHDDTAHKCQVLDFATFLRRQGVEAVLDTWAADVRQDWYAWAIREMTEADHVIVVASPKYREMGDGLGPAELHRGLQSEAALLREHVHTDRLRWLPKVLPVLLPGHDVSEIPLFLQPATATRYRVTSCTPEGAEELLRVLLGQPVAVPPVSAHRPMFSDAPRWTTLTSPIAVAWRSDLIGPAARNLKPVVELHLVPVGTVDRLSARRLRTIGGELAQLGRAWGLFTAEDQVRQESTESCAWARSTRDGLAVLRSRQRSAWFTAPGGRIRESGLAAEIASRIDLLCQTGTDGPEAWAPTIGVQPAFLGRRVRIGAEESVTDAELRRSSREIGEELAARALLAISRRPAVVPAGRF